MALISVEGVRQNFRFKNSVLRELEDKVGVSPLVHEATKIYFSSSSDKLLAQEFGSFEDGQLRIHARDTPSEFQNEFSILRNRKTIDFNVVDSGQADILVHDWLLDTLCKKIQNEVNGYLPDHSYYKETYNTLREFVYGIEILAAKLDEAASTLAKSSFNNRSSYIIDLPTI